MDDYNDKKNGGIIIIIALIIIIGFLIFTANKLASQSMNALIREEYKQAVVKNASEFFTVSSCVNKYLGYVSKKDKEKVLGVLDQKYIDDNSITEENIFDIVPNISTSTNQSSRSMYKKRINKNVVEYLVSSEISENIFDEKASTSKMYFKVYLIEKTANFAISPYDGEVFKND